MKPLLYIFAGSLLLSSCGLFGKDGKLYGTFHRDTLRIDSLTKHLYRDLSQNNAPLEKTDTASFGNMPWESVFTDTKLQQLIRTALERNVDIQKAELTVQQAEIGLRLNKLAFLPQVAFSPTGNISKAFVDGADIVKTYSLPVQASWQIDAFGTLRNAKKQGEHSLLQAKAAEQAAHTAIVAGVANLYYSLQMLDEQLQTTHRTLTLWEKSIATMEAMHQAGMLNSAAIASSRAQVLQLRATIPTLEYSIREAENALCVLLHESPHTIERSQFSAEGFPNQFSVGLPFSLLANRPDVAIAEANLASAFYGVQKARGAFFPQLTISASGAFTNSLGGLIMNPGKFLAAGVATITQPLFAKGQIQGAYEVSKIQQETAQLNFEQTLLTAGKEVSNAMASFHKANTRIGIVEQQVVEIQKAADDTEFLFKNGNTTTYLETLTAQMNLLNAQLSLINTRFEKVQAVIALYQALGGGRR